MSFLDSNLFLLNNGNVKACGDNSYGQLGLGNSKIGRAHV